MKRFVLISDTHNTEPPLPKGEVLIHAGDLTGNGGRKQTEAAMRWIGEQAKSSNGSCSSEAIMTSFSTI